MWSVPMVAVAMNLTELPSRRAALHLVLVLTSRAECIGDVFRAYLTAFLADDFRIGFENSIEKRNGGIDYHLYLLRHINKYI